MNPFKQPRWPIELYAIFPSVAGLVVLALIRADFASLFHQTLVAVVTGLLILAAAGFRLGILVTLIATWLSFYYFQSSAALYISGVVFAVYSLANTDVRLQGHYLQLCAVLVGLGLIPMIWPNGPYRDTAFRPLLDVLVALAALLTLLGIRRVRLAASIWHALYQPVPKEHAENNACRFDAYTVAFLTVGSFYWSDLTQAYPHIISLGFYLGFTLFLLPRLLDSCGLFFVATSTLDEIKSIENEHSERHKELTAAESMLQQLNTQITSTQAVLRSAEEEHRTVAKKLNTELCAVQAALRSAQAEHDELMKTLENEANAARSALTAVQTESLRLKEDAELEAKRLALVRLKEMETQFQTKLQEESKHRNRELVLAHNRNREQLQRELDGVKSHFMSWFFAQPWDFLVNALRTPNRSSVKGHPYEGVPEDHLLIGVRPSSEGPKPIFITREILNEHVHILGGTGSSKTSLGIMPLLIQLIRNEDRSNGAPFPIVIIDLKGDRALFHTARIEAENAGRDFLFFTLDQTKATYRFNPFVGIASSNFSANQKAEPLLDALGLNHGEGYGRLFFSRQHRARLLQVLRQNPKINSLKELYTVLRGNRKAPKLDDELLTALEGLFEYPQLFTSPKEELEQPEQIINFSRVLEKRQIVYFHLPSPSQSMSVRETAKLVLYNLFFASLRRQSEDLPDIQTYLFIDEFQRVVGEKLKLFFEQSRSYGIGMTLTSHNIDQLKTSEGDLWPVVLSNTRASLHFGSADPKEIELLSKASGEAFGSLTSNTEGSAETSGQSRTITRTVGEAKTVTAGSFWSESDSISNVYGESSSWGESSSQARSTASALTRSSSSTHGSSFSGGLSYGEIVTSNIMSGSHSSSTQGVGSSESSSSTIGSGTFSGEGRHTATGRSSTESSGRSRSESLTNSSSQSEAHGTSTSSTRSRENTLSQYVRPRLRYEDISSLFNVPGQFLFWVRRGSGLANFDGKPVPVTGIYTSIKEVYERRKALPWPNMPGRLAPSVQEKKLSESDMIAMMKQALESSPTDSSDAPR
jgi:plasmid stabilization system protein ParE